jgi:phage tail-like protein
MAKFANPRKGFNFSIEIIPDPINPFMFQDIKLPDTDVDQVEHGDTNHKIKTAGMVHYTNLTAEKLLPSDQGDTYMWGWIDTCQSAMLGGGAIPEIYKKTILVTEFAEDGSTPLNTWTYQGVWPCKVNGLDLSRIKSENSLEKIEFSVDELIKE